MTQHWIAESFPALAAFPAISALKPLQPLSLVLFSGFAASRD